MILKQFPEILTMAETVCKQAFIKGCGTGTYPEFYFHHLVGYTAALTGWPIAYYPLLDTPYHGFISFRLPGQTTDKENGPIILGLGQCYVAERELSLGHEIGHIFITYYNSLYTAFSLEDLTLCQRWILLSNKIILLNKGTGEKYSRYWFQNMRRRTNSDNDKHVQEALCEEIGLFLIAERKKQEEMLNKKIKETQLALF